MRKTFALIFLGLLWPGSLGEVRTDSHVSQQEEATGQQVSSMALINGDSMWNTSALWGNISESLGEIDNVTSPGVNDTWNASTYCKDGSSIYVKMTVVPVLALLGTTGNVLSFIVMGSHMYRGRSYGLYLRALAVFDTLTLFTFCVFTGNEIAAKFGSGGFLHLHTSLTCKLTDFLKNVVYLMSSWVIVAFTCDRYVAVCHPLQRARLCTETRAKVIICILLVVAMVTQAFRFYFVEKLDRSQPCHAPTILRIRYFGFHYFWFSFFLRFACPLILIIICNGKIIFHVYRMRKVGQTKERDKKRQAHLAITTLIVVCTVFIITLFPNAAIDFIMFLEFVVYKRATHFCLLFTLDTPFQMIRLLNYSTNFILYGLTGRLFRRELYRMLACMRRNGNTSSNQKVAAKVSFQLVHKRLPHLAAFVHNRPRGHAHDNYASSNSSPFLRNNIDNEQVSGV